MGLFIDLNKFWDETDGGLKVWESMYEGVKTKEHFKSHNENTPSSSLKKNPKGIWCMTNFSTGEKMVNPINHFMEKEGIDDFYEALEKLAAEHGVMGDKAFKASYEFGERKLEKDDVLGSYTDITEKEFTDSLHKVLGEYVTEEITERFKVSPLEKYGIVKDDKVLHFKSTDTYPIYYYNYGDWGKIYQPFAKPYRDKKTGKLRPPTKFYYIGDKPDNYVFGLEDLKKQWIKNKQNLQVNEDDHDSNGNETESASDKKAEDPRVRYAVICSGETDAMNLVSCGQEYWPIWFGSESVIIDPKTYRDLCVYAQNVCYLGDLDITGQRQKKETCKKYLDIRSIELPKWLLKKRANGKPAKDLKDFLRHANTKAFDHLAYKSNSFKFYNEIFVKSNKSYRYQWDDRSGLKWLNAHGFYTLASEELKPGDVFVHVVKNVAYEVADTNIRKFVLDYVDTQLHDVRSFNSLYNALNKSGSLEKKSLSALPPVTIESRHAAVNSQWFFFRNNQAARITKDGIEYERLDRTDKIVWSEQVIDHDLRPIKKPLFTAKQESKIDWSYTPSEDLSKDIYHRFMWNTSRIHWKKELYLEQKLTDQERKEQELHMVNKLYALGYLLHSFKVPSKSYFVLFMDHKESDVGTSTGGSGKSIITKCLERMKKTAHIDGKTVKMSNDNFVFDEVTKKTEYMLWEDLPQFFNYEGLFGLITGNFSVNPKHGKKFTVDQTMAAKMAGQTNHALPRMGYSMKRRMIICQTSDYYHGKGDEYRETQRPDLEFGMQLFVEFNQEQMNMFYTFMMQACAFHLATEEQVMPPSDSLVKRSLRAEMGDEYLLWADLYFDKDNLNTEVNKELAYLDYQKSVHKSQQISPIKFKKKLECWCLYHEFILTPKDKCNSGGSRIIRKVDNKSTEFIYIQTIGIEKTTEEKT